MDVVSDISCSAMDDIPFAVENIRTRSLTGYAKIDENTITLLSCR